VVEGLLLGVVVVVVVLVLVADIIMGSSKR
jgi:hypothetical protein